MMSTMLKNEVTEIEEEFVAEENLNSEELIAELDKLQGKEVTINVFGGVESIFYFESLDFSVLHHPEHCDIKLNFQDEENELIYCTISLYEIVKSYKDNLHESICLYLQGGQYIEIQEMM